MKDECVISPFPKDKDGYPRCKHQGRLMPVTRLIWTLSYGKIPDGKIICHTCDNPGCVNLKHLYLGTFYTNMKDKVSRRRVSGDNHPQVKISDKQVEEIRQLYDRGGMTQQELGKKYSVVQSAISSYVLGKRRSATQKVD